MTGYEISEIELDNSLINAGVMVTKALAKIIRKNRQNWFDFSRIRGNILCTVKEFDSTMGAGASLNYGQLLDIKDVFRGNE
jgi:hypothetical protein